MIVFSREVFLCKCSTEIPRQDPPAPASEAARRLRFQRGAEPELSLLDPAEHDNAQPDELRARLARSEQWLVGKLEGKIATYVWLHTRERIEYPYLPGCAFTVRDDTGYAYDAWTAPALRGQGLRRRAVLEELALFRSLGKQWEVVFLVKHQLDGATRSLAAVGVKLLPLWRVELKTRHGLHYEQLARGDDITRPVHVQAPP